MDKDKKEDLLETAGKMTSGAGAFLKNYIIDFALVIAVLVYVLRSVFTIGETGRGVLEILADGFMTLLFGFIISRALSAKGIMNGESSSAYLATMSEYSKVIDEVTPYIDELEAFCAKRNEEELRRLRTAILTREGIRYEAYAGGELDPAALSDEKRSAIRRANHVRLKTPLSTRFLTSENERRHGEKVGRSKSAFTKSDSGLDLLYKVGICITLSYFGIMPVESFSWYTLAWYVVQVGLFFLLGSLKYVSSYNFITDEFRNRILYKINLLYEFRNRHQKGEKFLPEEKEKEAESHASETVQAAE